MASQNGGYNAPTQQHFGSGLDASTGGHYGSTGTYGLSGGYVGSQQYPPSRIAQSMGDTCGSQGNYSYSQEPYPSSTAYPPSGSYGAIGEPLRPSGNGKIQRGLSPGRFSSPPTRFNSPQAKQEQNWQSFGNNYGNRAGQYGDSYGETYDSKNEYSDSMNNRSMQDSFSQNHGPSTYGQDYSQRGRGYSNRGDRRGQGFRGSRGTFGGTFRGNQGGSDMYRGHGMGRAKFDPGDGFNGGGSWRGAFGRGRGQYDGTRGRGQYGGMRGRGRGQQDGTRGRGRGRGRGFEQVSNMDWKSLNKGGKAKPQTCKVALEGDKQFISYKNSLQEYCQKLHKPVPQYTVTKVDVGYSASVVVDGVTYSCQTSQRERKFAELGAAFEALKGLGFIDASATFSPKGKKRSMTPNELATPKSKASKSESGIELNTYPSISYKSKLNEICQKMKSDSPSYSTVRASTGFVCTVVLNGQVYQSTQGFGTKKQAEQNAAEVVLSQLDFSSLAASGDQSSATQTSNAVITPVTNTPSSSTTSDTITSSSGVQASTTDSPLFGAPVTTPAAAVPKSMKNVIQEYCQKNGIPIPSYSTVKDSGMNISTITVNGVEYVGTPHAMKKTAEQNAAKKAIEELGVK